MSNVLTHYHSFLKLEKSFSDNTIEAYEHDLNKYLSFLKAENIHPFDVDLKTLHQFSSTLIDIGIQSSSLSRILSGIRNFYHFLVLDDYIQENPTELLDFPSKGHHLPDVLSIAEIDMMEDSIDLSQSEGQRNKAIIEILFSCGLRVSELCSLKLSDLYLEEGFIKISGKGNKQRLVPISDKAIKELKLYYYDRDKIDIKPGYEDYVFISKLRKKNLSRIMVFHIIKQVAENAGINKTVSPHTLRHSFATSLLEGGANLRAIQAMLGHESIATTEIYTHISTNKLKDDIINHHPRNMRQEDTPLDDQ